MFLVFVVTLFCIPQISVAASAGEINKQIVYVDGVEVEVYLDQNLNVVAKTTGLEEDAEIVLKPNGNAKVEIDSENGDPQELDVKIKSLSEDNVNVVIKEDGKVLDKINSMDELELDQYDGQIAIPVIPVGLLFVLTVVMLFAATKIISGVLTYAASIVSNMIQSNPQYKYRYFEAFITDGAVYVNLLKISDETAALIIKGGGNTYTFLQKNANSIIGEAGLVSKKYPEVDLTRKIGNLYLWHYHPTPKNGAHSFYGMPVI